ncbi:MAG: hypothetical protein ACT4QG_10470 [Sporichthyaceae bacterium]
MHTLRVRTLVAVVAAGVTLAGCGGHSGHNASAEQQNVSQEADAANPHAGMNMGESLGDGLEAEVEGYALEDVQAPTTAGKEGKLEFTIRGPAGKPHKEFVLELAKLMHTYVVRKDLTEFQHLHPELDEATGRWSIPITFEKPGPYRIVTEFEALTPDGEFDSRVLGRSFTVDGSYQAVDYTPDWGVGKADGYDLRLDANTRLHGPDLTLKVTKDGADVTDLQPYLQSWAHVTGFRQGDLKTVHMHPFQSPGKDPNLTGGPTLNLASLFSEAGRYRLFVQFQTAGKLRTAPIDIEVADHKLEGGGDAPASTTPASKEAGDEKTPAKEEDVEHSGH